MTERKPEAGLSRRRFLRATGGALGGVVLTLYGAPAQGRRGGGSGPPGQIPNGYTFHRVLTTPCGFVGEFTAAVMLASETPRIFFHGSTSTEGVDALWYLDVDFNAAPTPACVQVPVPVLSQGGVIPASRLEGVPASQQPVVADRIGTGDTNAVGHFATTLQGTDSGSTAGLSTAPGVFLFTPENSFFKRLAFIGDPAPGGGRYGGIFDDVALQDDDSVLFTATITDAPTSAAVRQALVYMPQAHPPSAETLLATGDLLPGTSAVITTFGLVDLAPDGSFVAQVTAAHREPGAPDRSEGTALVAGNVGRAASSHQLLAAAPHLLPRRTGRHRDVALGESHMGPRIARGGRVAHVAHTDSHAHHLLHNGRGRRGPQSLRRVGEAGGGAPGGAGPTVAALGAPVMSADGELTYVTELNADGTSTLTVTDGSTTQTLLSSNDSVDGSQITEILQGYHPSQADDAGRIVFAAEFLKKASGDPTDPNNVEGSLVVGIPT